MPVPAVAVVPIAAVAVMPISAMAVIAHIGRQAVILMKGAGDKASADVATAKAKTAIAINLIISVSPCVENRRLGSR